MTAGRPMHVMNDILKELRRLQPELRRRYPIREMGVIGSYVRGTQHAGSDVDVLVDFDAPIGLMEFVGLRNDIGDAIGLHVDLVMKESRTGRRVLSEVVML
ncbi:MAG TPA: nucleotidyltransferase family protein [Rhizomicrobium sp.]|nr:nucleotidyltransferase family protein [Rhizomicrobium sp.]